MTRFRKLLLALYAAGVAVLAWLMPYRPEAVIAVGGDEASVVGFDERGILVEVNRRKPDDCHICDSEYQVWDFVHRPAFGPPRRIAQKPAFESGPGNPFDWIVPYERGLRWLLWECVMADDPTARFVELFPNAAIQRRARHDRFFTSPDGRYAFVPQPDENFRVYERGTGRLLWTTPDGYGKPELLGDDLVVIREEGERGSLTVATYDLATGRERKRQTLVAPPRLEGKFYGLNLSPDSRYFVAHDGLAGTSFPIEVASGQAVVGWDRARHVVKCIGSPTRFLVIDLEESPPAVRIVDPTGRTAETDINTSAMPESAGEVVVNSDGSVVGLYSGASSRMSDWPAWLKLAYDQTIGRFVRQDTTLEFFATANGRSLGAITFLYRGPFFSDELKTFSSDGRWIALVTHAGPPGARAIVEVYAFPLRRPWLYIATWAALPPLALAMLAIMLRRVTQKRWAMP